MTGSLNDSNEIMASQFNDANFSGIFLDIFQNSYLVNIFYILYTSLSVRF